MNRGADGPQFKLRIALAHGQRIHASAFAQTNRWFIAAAVMLATFMEVLDTSIAAVALPYIAGSVSATNDEARGC